MQDYTCAEQVTSVTETDCKSAEARLFHTSDTMLGKGGEFRRLLTKRRSGYSRIEQ
jgi:hypothetical protein